MDGLMAIWPIRTTLAGVPLGDAWPCTALSQGGMEQGEDIVPFHKLTQWLTYSLVPVIEKGMGWEVVGMEDMTGLPEYRNGVLHFSDEIRKLMTHLGGLFVDFGVLQLKESVQQAAPKAAGTSDLPIFDSSHPAIIEWRALTVILLLSKVFF